MPLAVVTVDEALEQIAAWQADPDLTAINDDPVTGRFGRRYYQAIFADSYRDASFAITDGERPLLLASCARSETALDYFGEPIRFFPDRTLAPDLATAAIDRAFQHLTDLKDHHGIRRVFIRDEPRTDSLSPLGEACLTHGYGAALRVSAFADLSDGEAGLRRALRKSFKSLLNWGKQNLAIEVVNQANPDRRLFDSYREFHLRVAGRSTRPPASWEVMYDWITSGNGELVLATHEGEMASASLVLDGTAIAFYGSGVYDRDKFDKPMAHWPLWLAMLHARDRGLRRFLLGDIPLAGAATPKEINIGYFKRGFASRLVPWLGWRWDETSR